MLEFVGIGKPEERAYRALVAVGATTARELAAQLGESEESAATALRALQRRGLAAPSAAAPGRFVAAPPSTALAPHLSQRRHELKQAELAVEMLAQAYRRSASDFPGHDLVEVVTGVEALQQRFHQVQLGAQRELLALVTEDPMAVRPEDNDAEPLAVARGVSHRVVLNRAVLDRPGGLDRLDNALTLGQHVRLVETVPTKLIVVDRSLAMVPLREQAQPPGVPAPPGALLVRAPGLVEALVALFELVWESAMPMRLDAEGSGPETDDTDQPDGVDLRIMSMLLVGMTDASVAKQLDLGLRTVQRRIKRLLDLAGATTRLQLGWYAHEKGWVTR